MKRNYPIHFQNTFKYFSFKSFFYPLTQKKIQDKIWLKLFTLIGFDNGKKEEQRNSADGGDISDCSDRKT